jgi:flagellar protein FlaG
MEINFLIPPLDITKLDNNLPKTHFFEKSNNVQTKPEKESSEIKPVPDDKLKNLQNSLAEHNITMKFRQDEKTKQLVVELVDNKTGESIRQIPTEVSLKLSQMSVQIQGQFIDDKV